MRVEGNRPFVDLTFKRPDETERTATFLVDTGGGGFLLTEALANDLGLEHGDSFRGQGREFAQTSVGDARLGSVRLSLSDERTFVVVGTDNFLPPVAPGHADGMFPGHVLAQYSVTFDYRAGTFSLATAAASAQGAALPMTVGTKSGFPRVLLEIDGAEYGFLLDTGASYTMVSEALLQLWGEAHPDWTRVEGPVEEAKTLGGQAIETIIVPDVGWGPLRFKQVGAVSQRRGTFEDWMSAEMDGAIIGALAGNVLKDLRLELDYRGERVYVVA